ncbi:protein kinase domain-containing protein [Gimesia sp.]|uniref:serine/threonine protein kinase n=1 Tax=Gimesia sp. TaxID=2024833 RepID=UPI003A8E36C2
MVGLQSPNESDDQDRLLEEFEKQWRNGETPEIENLLAGLSESARSSLLPDLVELDQEYRWKQFFSEAEPQTKPVLLNDYLQRFPELGSIAQLNSALIIREFQSRLSTVEEISLTGFVAEYDLKEEVLIRHLDHLFKEQQASLPPAIPGYDKIEPLGQGGMGVVYRARQKRMKRPVAIKLIPAHLHDNTDLRKRFEREMQAAAALNHHNIVTAYHADEYQQMLYLVSELADGENLSTIIRQQGPFSVERTVSVILQIAEGLSHAHQRGVIHRDIKPGNLIYNQQKNFVQILDFGLAKFRDQSQLEDDTSTHTPDLTSTGAIMGTVNYMAPEQALDTKTADERSDIYSLGCVLHFLLTGEPPFGGSTVMSRLLAHREQPIPDLSQTRPEIPDELNSIFSRMIAKDPQDRYATMDEVISALLASGISFDQDESTLISQEQNQPEKQDLVNATTIIMPQPARSQRRNVFLAIGMLSVLGLFGFAFKNSWQGETVPRPETELPSENSPVSPAPATESVAENSPVTVPAQVTADDDELPSLNEWLKGREVLTVAQDGSGQFSSIQSACEALKEGQVVEVLDRGPYRETLRVGKFPPNTGLVSRMGTVLALDSVSDSFNHKGRYFGHALNNIKEFRLSGIYFSRGGHRRDVDLVNISPCQDLTVDHCVFEAPPSVAFDNTHQYSKRHYSSGLTVKGSKTIQVRHCIFGSSATFYAEENTQLSLKHNWFQPGLMSQLDISTYHKELKERCQIDIETNVFSQNKYKSISFHLPENTNMDLSIQQNLFHGGAAIGFLKDLSHHPVIIQKNVFLKNTQPLWFSGNAMTDFNALPDQWRILNNVYYNDYDIGKMILRPADGNVKIQTSSYLASLNDPEHFLRYQILNTTDTIPTGCGAYPPGPAPVKGDWLTKLIERWSFARPFISEAETEGMADWLTGRTIRTVSQDGKGEFKSIQAALEALQPGEVVEVLDQGPYQEKIYIEERPLPENIGLISRVGTVIKTPEWNTVPHPQGHHNIYGHNLVTAGSFRLQGFDFEMEQAIPNARLVTIGVTGKNHPNYVVVMDCVFQAPEKTSPEDRLKGLLISTSGEIHVSNNLFVSAAELDLYGNTILAVDQNWFLGEHVQLMVRGYEDENHPTNSVIIAENVFDSPKENSIVLQEIGSTNQISKIFQNTFFQSVMAPIKIRNGFEQQKTEIYQNLYLTEQNPLAFTPNIQPNKAAIKAHWRIEENGYSQSPENRIIDLTKIDPRLTNVSVLSESRSSPEYLHISDESPLAGATDQPDEWLPVIGAMMPDSVSADNDWFSELQAKWKTVEAKR